MTTEPGHPEYAPPRSMLYAPANEERKLRGALRAGADAVIFDLQDTVPTDQKAEARSLVARVLSDITQGDDRPPCRVGLRLNSWSSREAAADILACVRAGVDFVAATTIVDAAEIARLDGALLTAEIQQGLTPGTVAILPEIDSAYGVLEVKSIIGASPRVRQVKFGGGEDFCNSLGVSTTDAGHESEWSRQYIVMVSSLCGILSPLHGNGGGLSEPEVRNRKLRHAASLGYSGASCIHPKQVAVTNEIFGVSEQELLHAHAVLAAYGEVASEGRGAATLAGELVDEAHVRRAHAVLRRAQPPTEAPDR